MFTPTKTHYVVEFRDQFGDWTEMFFSSEAKAIGYAEQLIDADPGVSWIGIVEFVDKEDK